MKKIFSLAMVLILLITLVAIIASPASADKPGGCTEIKDGTLLYATGHYLEGQLIPLGYDPFGYNYQAHQFNGSYANAYLGRPGQKLPPYEGNDAAYYQRLVDEDYAGSITEAEALMSTNGYWPHRDIQLMMKWSDIWLSNKDCTPKDGVLDRGGPGGTSSAADGAWLTNHQRGTDENGNWTYYVKIVYPPGGDIPEGAETIWGAYIVLQRVSSGEGATNYAQPVGFGAYK